MSWNLNVPECAPSEISNELRRERDNKAEGQDWDEEVAEQVRAAIEAAVGVAPAVGGDKVTVTIAGHANPNHEPREGWANDEVTVTVRQLA